jgi:2-dehydro-3-deoxyphosphooctonate aldolase (KDO 8-P synthase)
MPPDAEEGGGGKITSLPFPVGPVAVGGSGPLVLIAGPCVIESRAQSMEVAQALKEMAREVGVSLIFKSSYDKANRTSLGSYRGPGLTEGLEILAEVRDVFGVPVLSDVHSRTEVEPAGQVLDVIQIPAFLCRQTDLLICAAQTGRAINVKKGQFLGPWDMRAVLEKIWSTGNRRVMVSERGVTFGYQNLVVDFRSLVILRGLGAGLVFDATHSVQLPGGQGHASGGEREFVPFLSKAAVAVGIDALFLEVHPDPDRARCDGPNSLPISGLKELLCEIVEIHGIVKKQASGRR